MIKEQSIKKLKQMNSNYYLPHYIRLYYYMCTTLRICHECLQIRLKLVLNLKKKLSIKLYLF